MLSPLSIWLTISPEFQRRSGVACPVHSGVWHSVPTSPDGNGAPVGVIVDSSDPQSTTVTFDTALIGDDYSITIHDTAVAAQNNAPIDGDGDGVAGGDATFTISHRCVADSDGDGTVGVLDFLALLAHWGSCP